MDHHSSLGTETELKHESDIALFSYYYLVDLEQLLWVLEDAWYLLAERQRYHVLFSHQYAICCRLGIGDYKLVLTALLRLDSHLHPIRNEVHYGLNCLGVRAAASLDEQVANRLALHDEGSLVLRHVQEGDDLEHFHFHSERHTIAEIYLRGDPVYHHQGVQGVRFVVVRRDHYVDGPVLSCLAG